MQDTNAPVPLRDPMVHDLHIRLSKVEGKYSDQNRELGELRSEVLNVKEDTSAIRGGINKLLWTAALSFFSLFGTVITFILTNGLEKLFAQ